MWHGAKLMSHSRLVYCTALYMARLLRTVLCNVLYMIHLGAGVSTGVARGTSVPLGRVPCGKVRCILQICLNIK